MGIGSFLKRPFKAHRAVARRIMPKGTLGRGAADSSTLWGHDGMIPLDQAPQRDPNVYQRSPELQARLNAYGADAKLAAARAKYAAQLGPRPQAAAPEQRGGLGQTVNSLAQQAAQQILSNRQQAVPPVRTAASGGGGPTPGRIVGYADGGKVINRKPNGKPR